MTVSGTLATRRMLAVNAIAALAVAFALGSCSQSKTKAGAGVRLFRDERISRSQLEELSNAFADRYFTLMVSASERIMRGNPDVQ